MSQLWRRNKAMDLSLCNGMKKKHDIFLKWHLCHMFTNSFSLSYSLLILIIIIIFLVLFVFFFDFFNLRLPLESQGFSLPRIFHPICSKDDLVTKLNIWLIIVISLQPSCRCHAMQLWHWCDGCEETISRVNMQRLLFCCILCSGKFTHQRK